MALADTREQKRRWLGRYRKMVDEIFSLECLEQERLTAVAGTSANVLDGMPRPPQPANKSDLPIIKHLDVCRDLAELRRRSEDTRREIAAAINRLDDPKQAQVLRYKYINGFGWPEMQARMHYSRGGLYGLHKRAIDRLEIPAENLESEIERL